MLNYWWLCSEVVIAALASIAEGTPHTNPLINSGAAKFAQTDGASHFELFKTVTKDTKEWKVANVYGVTQEETDAYLNEWPNDIELGGCWERSTGRAQCPQHADLIQYMPDDCHALDQNWQCVDWQPATKLKQVILVSPQEPRQFT